MFKDVRDCLSILNVHSGRYIISSYSCANAFLLATETKRFSTTFDIDTNCLFYRRPNRAISNRIFYRIYAEVYTYFTV